MINEAAKERVVDGRAEVAVPLAQGESDQSPRLVTSVPAAVVPEERSVTTVADSYGPGGRSRGVQPDLEVGLLEGFGREAVKA